MAVEPEQAAAAQETAVHIVYVDRPEGADTEEFHIRTLSPILDSLLIWGVNFGNEEKARDAVLYHYKHAANGFSVKLTAEQVEDLKMTAVRKASVESGFFYVTNHRIPDGLPEALFVESKKFFELPLEEKMLL